MIDRNENLQEFVDNAGAYILKKLVIPKLSDTVKFYRAVVKSAPVNNKVKVQRPFDNREVEVLCVGSANSLQVGDQCVVFYLGDMVNSIVFGNGTLSDLGAGADVSNKYDKTGGNISGDVDIDGALKLNIADPDYDVDISFRRRLDNNRGTILTLQGQASGTPYKVAVENVGTPVNNFDAANKKYVDDLCSITWITGIYADGALTLSSDAYNKCYEAVTTNKTCYCKVTETGRVSVLRLKGWINYNDHSTHGDSFLFVDAVDDDTNKQIVVSYSAATYASVNLEHSDNKVTSWSSPTTHTHYPSEKLVEDTIVWLKNYVDDQYGAHVVWEVQDPDTDGVTASSGDSEDLSGNGWTIQNLDLSPYKYILTYIKGAKGSSTLRESASFTIRVDLDARGLTPRCGLYCGTQIGYAINDNGVKAGAVINVDGTKTKVAMTYSNFNTTGTTAISGDFKLYKIEGYKA